MLIIVTQSTFVLHQVQRVDTLFAYVMKRRQSNLCVTLRSLCCGVTHRNVPSYVVKIFRVI